MNDYLKGLLITLAGVLIITPDSLLIRLVSADSGTILFWRNFTGGILLLIALKLYYGKAAWQEVVKIGRAGLIMALVWAVGTHCFIFSIKHTLVANTLFIISTAPIFSALIAWLVLREVVRLQTWLTILACLCGIALIASGSMSASGGGSIVGDLAALGTALAVAIGFSIARHNRHVSMLPAVAISGLIAAAMAVPFMTPVVWTPQNTITIIILGVVIMPLGTGLMILGPRYLPAADVSLLLLVEAVLGPLLVWMFLDEHPGNLTLLGGVLVLSALAISNAWTLWRTRRISQAA